MKFTDPTWTCVRCNKEFEFWPGHGEPPFAVDIVTDTETGLRKYGGDICKPCHDAGRATLRERE